MRQKTFVLAALAAIIMGTLAACGTTTAELELDKAVLRELADAERGDILRMRDGRICVTLLKNPRLVLGSTKGKPETYEIRISCDIDTYYKGGSVAKFVPRVFRVIKPTDPMYNVWAGHFLRQRRSPMPPPEPTTHTGGIVGGRGVPVQH